MFQPGDIIYLKKGSYWREQFNLTASGTKNNYITITSYGKGERPVISGADIISGFSNAGENIWSVSSGVLPGQVFVNQVRGEKKNEMAQLTAENDWFYNNTEKILYIYKNEDPSLSFIEISIRPNVFLVSGSFIRLSDLQLEKSYRSAVEITEFAEGNIAENLEILQWASGFEISNAGVFSAGWDTEINNCSFGKNTGNETGDQQWAGVNAIRIYAGNASIHNNAIYHNSIENENRYGLFANGIFVDKFSGTLKIFGNYIYHTGSHGIRISGYSFQGDSVFIYENIIEYPGQAGILAFKTRAEDGIGGKGYVYRNEVSYANRLGGDVGSGGAQSCGIHMNDGILENTEPGKPFIRWQIYENIVHHNKSLADPGSEDSGGIIADFNSHGTEIFRNLIYNNYGKGISVWNANNTKIYYNIVYGNDAGIVISAANGTNETASGHFVYNNTLYKNYNGNDKGTNLNTEIFFGKNGSNSVFQNNIIYASDEGYACIYDTTNTSGAVLNHNLFYKDKNDIMFFDQVNRQQNFNQWQNNHKEWDENSINSFPEIGINPADPFIAKTSPAIDKGLNVGQFRDFRGAEIIGAPDIGAIEYQPSTSVENEYNPGEFSLSQNYPNPFNPETNITFHLGSRGHVVIKIYDILGRHVETLFNGDLDEGKHSLQFNTKNTSLAAGIYFYTLYFDGITEYKETKKMILLK
jgi:parallel beta-helix repeat protein